MKKTFIFSDFEYVGGAFYKNIVRFAKRVNFNTAKAVFGFDGRWAFLQSAHMITRILTICSSNIGKIHFASIQGATAFAGSFPHIFGEDEAKTAKIPCLIPCAIDQDPYFRLTRDCAAGLKYAKPSLIHMRFLDALQGPGSKMSASDDTSAIFMSDSAKTIKTKINKYGPHGYFIRATLILSDMPFLAARRHWSFSVKRAATRTSTSHTSTCNFSWRMTPYVP